MIEQDVLDLSEIDRTRIAVAGGKGAHLGALSRIDGVHVPAGFCVTTAAFRRIMAEAPGIDDQLDRLSRLTPDDRDGIRSLSAELRRTIEAIAMPGDLATAVTGALARLGERAAYAVRSSATAEDLPTASFAGQQDTYLNVVGPAEILRHVCRCWASLFTERAVTYRQRNGIDHRKVHMAVVVQRMVVPRAAGVLFTADPVTSNRRVASVEASFGLGEALVSGRVDPDVFTVRDGELVDRTVGTKRFAIEAAPGGGTREVAIALATTAPSRTLKTSAFTRPETRASPRPKLASTEATFRLDVTGSAVNMMPADRGNTIRWITTAIRTARSSMPWCRR